MAAWHRPRVVPPRSGGAVIGASDARGALPADRPVRPPDLAATIFQLLGLPPDREFRDPLDRPLAIAHKLGIGIGGGSFGLSQARVEIDFAVRLGRCERFPRDFFSVFARILRVEREHKIVAINLGEY